MYISIFLGMIALYLYLIMPRVFNKRDLSLFENRHYAHRGLHDNTSMSPENSLNAMVKAIDKGYGIEFDVQLTKDDIPVVFHDFSLGRVCGLESNLEDLTYEELLKLRLYSSDETIPSLSQVLELVNGKVPLIVEFKSNKNTDTKVCEIASVFLDNYHGDYAVESFNPFPVLWYKKNRPRTIRGQLSSNFMKERRNSFFLDFSLTNLMFNFMTKPDFVAYHHPDKKNVSLFINKYLFRVFTIAFTVKSQKEMDENMKFYDLLIFEGFIPK